MLKKILFCLLALSLAFGALAQLPRTNIYLFDVKQGDEGKLSFTKPRFLTDFNRNGYNGDPFDVHCDMTSDGGGYTFLKLAPGQPTFAAGAEIDCASWGMQLWIPRSLEHKNSGWAVANDANIGPGASANYMLILGIYPSFNGATWAPETACCCGERTVPSG